MKSIVNNLNKAFENRLRLGAMSLLMVNEWVDFNELKETLDATDGNLASHLAALEKSGYIEVRKEFVGRKPKTSYQATRLGRKAFRDHLDTLEKIIRNNN